MNRECDGVVYKITDLETGQFYIGETQRDRWDRGYFGSGTRWKNHYRSHPDHLYKRELLHDSIDSFDELYYLELEEIRRYCEYKNGRWQKANKLMLNQKYSLQPDIAELSLCEECGALRGHYKTCSKYISRDICDECGASAYGHLKKCSRYKKRTPCSECGGTYRHKTNCSKYHYNISVCSECGERSGKHREDCSKYKPKRCCEECGALRGHRNFCSHAKFCPECGYSIQSRNHAKSCSHYKARTPCKECGSYGRHTIDCSKYVDPGRCLECGYSLQSRRHSKSCSRYKDIVR